MKFAVFDIETNGFLQDMTKIHLLTIKKSDAAEVEVYRDFDMDKAAWELMVLEERGYRIVGHNIIKFDIPAIQKIYPWFNIKFPWDTLVISRLKHGDIGEQDAKSIAVGKLPSENYGSHSLESWGYRLGCMKGEYEGDTRIEDVEARKAQKWAEWNPDMETYGIQDAVVTEKLLYHLAPWNYSPEAIELEHGVATIIGRQERFGVCFNEQKAGELYASLAGRRADLNAELLKTVPGSWWPDGPLFTPKKDSKKYGYAAGAQLQRIEWREFKPSSRQHIVKFLMSRYGWKPMHFTDGGDPQIDEDILADLKYPEAKPLNELFMVEKRIGMLAEGTQAWLRAVRSTGRIHGSVNTNGAVTGRMTHSSPNLGQVPACGKPYGAECRALFGPPKGMVQVGADASGLELRCLAHFMARWDDGAYAREVLHGDIHTANQKAAGLSERAQAKTFI